MYSTNYVVIFVVAMTSLVAISLTTLREVTKDQAIQNEATFNKRQILMAVSDHLGEGKDIDGMSDDEVLEVFSSQVEQLALNNDGNKLESAAIQASGYKGGKPENIDMAKEKKKPLEERIFPLYIFNSGAEKFYIMSVRGNGLWDEIWGNIALESDFNTIAGAAFDHKGETPGLGAEIKDNPAFAKRFKGTKIYNEEGEFVSVYVRKGGAKDPDHEVDGISGATVTADGVTEMLYRGLDKYQPFIEEQKTGQPVQGMLIK